MKIGVVGNGFVGHAMTLLRPGVDVLVWDINPDKCEPHGIGFNEFVDQSEIIFVAVPTPMEHDGTCHLNIVQDVVTKIKTKSQNTPIVLRSTVPPGTSDQMNVHFMPEFLTERFWETDFKTCTQWIIGTHDMELVGKIEHMFQLAHAQGSVDNKQVIHMKPTEAEMVKYTKNCFLAVKVSYFNEMYKLCEKLNVDYESVRSVACDDPRLGHGQSLVPGHDGHLGYGGTCLPKDTNAMIRIMQQHDVECHVINGAVIRNEFVDRPEKDWQQDKGRASI